MILFALSAGLAFAETNVGIVYGSDGDIIFTDHQTLEELDLFVAATESGLFFDHFRFYDHNNFVRTYFTGSRLISFKGYILPFFGKVADIWLEGYFGNQPNGGRPTIAHFRITDPVGFGVQYSFLTMDIYLPGDLKSPIFSRVAVGYDYTHVLIADDAGPPETSPGFSSNGMAYSKLYLGTTNRREPAAAVYRVASNGLIDFSYGAPNTAIQSVRLRSFKCTNASIVGKEAEIWFDARFGPNGDNMWTPRIVRLIVTQSASSTGLEFMYIEVYDPGNLLTPVYQRLIFGKSGQNHILCK